MTFIPYLLRFVALSHISRHLQGPEIAIPPVVFVPANWPADAGPNPSPTSRFELMDAAAQHNAIFPACAGASFFKRAKLVAANLYGADLSRATAVFHP
jgi:hypothetical protein